MGYLSSASSSKEVSAFLSYLKLRPDYLWIPPARRRGTTSSDVLRCFYIHHAISIATPPTHRELTLTQFSERISYHLLLFPQPSDIHDLALPSMNLLKTNSILVRKTSLLTCHLLTLPPDRFFVPYLYLLDYKLFSCH